MYQNTYEINTCSKKALENKASLHLVLRPNHGNKLRNVKGFFYIYKKNAE